MFEKELEYFVKHQDQLVKKHKGRVLVIRGETVEGVYDSLLEAYLESKAAFRPGSYLIQPCIPGPEAYTVTIA